APEAPPGGQAGRHGAPAGLAPRPVGRREPEGALSHVGTVDEEVLPAHEQPAPAAPLVAIVILDQLDDPSRALGSSFLDLAPAVDDTARVVFVFEVHHVVADLEEGDAGGAQLAVEVGAKGGVSR